jgi:nitrogen fixation protein NifU and related proteins
MSADLRELYQSVIIDHGRQPRNFGRFAAASLTGEGFNALCGDRIVLDLLLHEGVIEKAVFEGVGCAISVASASLMTDRLKGKNLEEAKSLFADFHALVTEGRVSEKLGKLAVFAGVQEFPARVKCATLAWHTLLAAISGKKTKVSTEET